MDVQELIDRQEIIDRLNRYAELVDTGRPRDVPGEIFADEMVEDHGGGAIHTTHEALADFLEQAIAPFDSCMHYNTNFQIEVDGDRATSRTSYLAVHWLKGGDDAETRAAEWAAAGIYLDVWRRTPAGWRIEHRRRRNVGLSPAVIGSRPRHLVDLTAP